jgi:hypothetical protein
MLDLSRHTYLYAQALDNKGDPEYWRAHEAGTAFDRLTLDDSRLPLIRDFLDELTVTGCHWRIGDEGLDCRVSWKGACVITIHPETRDVDGRISPVLLLFNALGHGRSQAASALNKLEALTGRSLNVSERKAIGGLNTLMSRPRLVILFHILFFSRRAKSD